MLGNVSETKQSRRIRVTLIIVLVFIVGGAILFQNQLLHHLGSSSSENQKPLMASHIPSNHNTKVAMVRKREGNFYLVSYDVQADNKFVAVEYTPLDLIITELMYDEKGNLWMKRKGEWSRLNEELKVQDSGAGFEKNNEKKYSFKVLEENGKYRGSVKQSSQSVWEQDFEQKPVSTVPLDEGRELWIVLFDNFNTTIMKSS